MTCKPSHKRDLLGPLLAAQKFLSSTPLWWKPTPPRSLVWPKMPWWPSQEPGRMASAKDQTLETLGTNREHSRIWRLKLQTLSNRHVDWKNDGKKKKTAIKQHIFLHANTRNYFSRWEFNSTRIQLRPGLSLNLPWSILRSSILLAQEIPQRLSVFQNQQNDDASSTCGNTKMHSTKYLTGKTYLMIDQQIHHTILFSHLGYCFRQSSNLRLYKEVSRTSTNPGHWFSQASPFHSEGHGLGLQFLFLVFESLYSSWDVSTKLINQKLLWNRFYQQNTCFLGTFQQETLVVPAKCSKEVAK